MPRALVLAPSCFPVTQPEAHVSANLMRALNAAGWELDIITNPVCGSWYPDASTELGPLYDHVHFVHPATSLRGRLARLAAGTSRSGHLVGGYGWAYPAFCRALELTQRRSYDVLLSRALPDYGHLAGLLVARATGLPWVANWNDPVPLERAPAPYGGGLNAPLSSRVERFLRAVARTADLHTFPSARLADWVGRYLPEITPARRLIVPHIARADDVPPSCAPVDRMVLVVSGSLRPPRDPGILLDAVARFVRTFPDRPSIELRFLTERPEGVVAAARERGLEDLVRIDPPLPYEEAFAALAGAHVGVILEAAVTDGVFLPSKLVDYAQHGLPVLAVSPPDGTLADLLGRYGGGIVADVRAPDAVMAAISRLYEGWREGELTARYGSSALAGEFATIRVVSLLEEAVRSVTDPAQGAPGRGTGRRESRAT